MDNLFFWDSHLNHVLDHTHRIGRNVYHSRHLHRLTRAHIKLTTVARADNVEAFEVSVPNRTIIMGADIANREKLPRYVENNQRPPLHFHKQSFFVRQFRGGCDFDELNFGFVKCCVVEYDYS